MRCDIFSEEAPKVVYTKQYFYYRLHFKRTCREGYRIFAVRTRIFITAVATQRHIPGDLYENPGRMTRQNIKVHIQPGFSG